MKKYVKPTIEFIELKPEERLANCGWSGYNPSNLSVTCIKGHGES